MNSPNPLMLHFLLLLSFSFSWPTSSAHSHQNFLQCLFLHNSQSSTPISNLIYTPTSSSYSSVLEFNMQNLRFNTTSTPKPLLIVTPTNASHIQTTIYCSKKHNIQVRIRGGGHDHEGRSYVSDSVPFVLIDLVNLRTINVDVTSRTAWIQGGATLGEVYHKIAQKTRTLGFPGGLCPTVGVGGHFSGGGYGILMRKFGLAADNIVDAHIIDANGRILDRASMGEEQFWAIRGGGGNTFGVVIAWKVNLVPVPPTVTMFSSRKTLEQNAIKLVHRWQYVANKLPDDIWLQLLIRTTNSTPQGDMIVRADFNAIFLGRAEELLALMHKQFPELGLVKEDCVEMSWIEAQTNFGMIAAGFPIDSNISLDILINRNDLFKVKSKGKTDFVTQPIPEKALEGMWNRLLEGGNVLLAFVPYGGKMSEISDSSIPFPHRAGNLYKIGYGVTWTEEGESVTQRHMSWIRRLYNYMTPYVSKNPRLAYMNYRDLDIGMNNVRGNTSYNKARIWGVKYFKNNFDKLVLVKTKVDPDNFFRNEQSIPPLTSW